MTSNTNNSRNNACVVVLGDLGRSPRMQYHVESLIEENYDVDIITYLETKPLNSITSSTSARIRKMYQFPEIHLPNAFKYVLKSLWQALSLIKVLLCIKKPSFLLIQNPPAIPTFVICYLYSLLFRSKLIIDWHNYSYSILALTSEKRGFFVKLAYNIEKIFGRKAHFNFCVTKAMKNDLSLQWGINSTVLYDRPPKHFRPITIEEKHELFYKLSQLYSQFLPRDSITEQNSLIESTLITEKSNGEISLKNKRPGIIMSSTSWTADENFQILLDALQKYDEFAENNEDYPELLCIITGNGPLKDFYKKIISSINWSKIHWITPWLEAGDYSKLLASVDLGISLHQSSSGLDLPMKVVDMFGCGLPVCALNFNCLKELVIHEKNGYIFDTSDDLYNRLKYWFYQFPNNTEIKGIQELLKQNLEHFQALRWRENWKLIVSPTLRSLE